VSTADFRKQMSFARFECEHIVAEKHGGATAADNLALACPFCNRFKGTDLGSLDPDTGQLTPFFHPRNHQWGDHFRLEGARVVPLTPEGRVTVLISNSTTLIGSLSVNRSSSLACTRKTLGVPISCRFRSLRNITATTPSERLRAHVIFHMH
jgi:HNH endonuclease